MARSLDPGLFFEGQREAMKVAALRAGGPAVVALIRRLEAFPERLVLYTLARQVLVIDGGLPGGLDAAIAVADSGLAEVEAGLTVATDPAEREHLLRALHMLNFNLAADLADCWPGDEIPRERRHFERGLRAADALLSPLFQGAVMPHVLANDHWVRGMHRLSLGLNAEARESWIEALRFATAAARGEGAPETGLESTLQVLLLTGYFGLGNIVQGGDKRETGQVIFELALAYLKIRETRPDDAVEAGYFVRQLEKVRARYGGDSG